LGVYVFKGAKKYLLIVRLFFYNMRYFQKKFLKNNSGNVQKCSNQAQIRVVAGVRGIFHKM